MAIALCRGGVVLRPWVVEEVMSKPASASARRMRAEAKIRKATPVDGDVLCDLICALADYERLPQPDEAARERLKRDAFGESPRFDAWLAEVNGRPGGLRYHLRGHGSTFLALAGGVSGRYLRAARISLTADRRGFV
jgi:hypothetical protein